MGSCEHGNKTYGSIKAVNFLRPSHSQGLCSIEMDI